jgi:biopolymer transport protein ExbD
MSGGSAAYGGSGPAGDVYFNYTPLVDVTFNLIIYFVLTSTINTQAMARVIVPTVHQSAAVATDAKDKVVVNVVSAGSPNAKDDPFGGDSGTAKNYQIDAEDIAIGDMDKLVKLITKKRDYLSKTIMGGKAIDFSIEVRADYRVEYKYIEPILIAASRAGIRKMNITTLIEQKRQE